MTLSLGFVTTVMPARLTARRRSRLRFAARSLSQPAPRRGIRSALRPWRTLRPLTELTISAYGTRLATTENGAVYHYHQPPTSLPGLSRQSIVTRDPRCDGDGGGAVGWALCDLVARGQTRTARSRAACGRPQPADPVGHPARHRPQPLFPGRSVRRNPVRHPLHVSPVHLSCRDRIEHSLHVGSIGSFGNLGSRIRFPARDTCIADAARADSVRQSAGRCNRGDGAWIAGAGACPLRGCEPRVGGYPLRPF